MVKERLKSLFRDYSRVYPLVFSVVFVVVIFQYSFSMMEATLYDLRAKFDFGTSESNNIVLITMDERSDEFLGERYPYTYASHTRLMKELSAEKPLAIGYLVDFNSSADKNLEKQGDFKSAITQYTNNGGNFRFGTDIDQWGEKLPPQEIRDLGFSLSIINRDSSTFSRDDVVRRMVLNISGEESLHLWMANKFRARNSLPPLSTKDIRGSYYNREADAHFALFRYYTTPVEGKTKIRRIPFHKVAVGNFPANYFKDKIVLIGSSYISRSFDYVLTPFDTEKYRSSKLALHSEMIEALIQEKTVYQLPKIITKIIALLLAFVVAFSLNRVTPKVVLITVSSLLAAIFVISYLAFAVAGIWIYTVHLALVVAGVYYIGVPFRAIVEYQQRYAIEEESKVFRKVEKLKRNFISLMSHDLKTPVAKIAGMADVMMQTNRTNPELVDGLGSIVESTKDLNSFITSILDLTKVESRNIELMKVSKDVNTIIEQVVDEFKFEARRHSINIESELAPLYPIEIDMNLIKRVISNIMGNAVKYSGEGTSVGVKSWDDDQWVYIEIADTGVGIPNDDLEHIFEKFYRVKNDANHSIKGSGLGLYLVKYFVELHGGKIEVTSTLGQGTTFLIKLINA